MAEQQDEKSKLPLAGIFAVVAIISSFLIYEGISLRTSRPIDKEAASKVFLEEGLVQARLWQDPFEAVETHRLQEAKQPKRPGLKDDPHTLNNLIKVIKKSGISSGLRILPVFVDGSPYVSSVESRLKDRYAMVSALGAAGYVPESGEHIRLFKWEQEKTLETDASSLLVPVELFIPKAKLRNTEVGKHVLVVWLKDQDFVRLDNLLAHLDEALGKSLPQIEPVYSVLGPRSSATLSAMLKELRNMQSNLLAKPLFSTLKHLKLFSPWVTAEDTFLLDDLPGQSGAPGLSGSSSGGQEMKSTVEQLFKYPRIEFIRTIATDAMLAEYLLQELKRRQVDLKPCPDKDCNPKIALISEWDTLYGRSLPRTFAAVAMNNGSGKAGPALESEINKLRRDEWPGWITPHSYLAGLDGELPTKEDDKKTEGIQARVKAWYEGKLQDTPQNTGQRPEGRSQLDYLLRLAAALKQEEVRSGQEFKAIGVLGSDVYDKLLILQALRQIFPRAIFFTTDLNARLAYPPQWQFTRNLIVASHFGLELQRTLQTHIPPFRDNYQTSLFYTALWALEHFSASADCPDCFQLSTMAGKEPEPMIFSGNAAPRLYEIGRHGAFDISTGATDDISTNGNSQDSDYLSIHAPRPDLEADSSAGRNLKWIAGAALAAIALGLVAMLISSAVADACLKLASNRLFWLGLAVAGAATYGVVAWVTSMMPNPAENEPFTLTEGISAWPAASICLLAIGMSVAFLSYSWRKMKDNERILAHDFNLKDEDAKPADKLDCEPPGLSTWSPRRSVGIHAWRPQEADHVHAAHLWQEYAVLGQLGNLAMRCTPQVALALFFAFLMTVLFGFPNTPCRGEGCFEINDAIIILSVIIMLILIFYVIDATRLCRRWVDCVAIKRIQWAHGRFTKIARERGQGTSAGMDKENLDEWLGIELIAERTKVIGNFIYFPFVIMFLLAMARHNYFDHWGFPATLGIIFTVNAALLFVNAMALRHSAEMAKQEAIKRLEKKLIEIPDQAADEESQKEEIEWTLEAIRDNQKGAFLPFTKHPVFGAAIALPSGGYGLILLFEYLATAF
ncbi:hypothetical protein [Nitrosospira sp. NpAV]|uniref:hypothetical protein n=1 Tax=Nitrosospira sp. NpAV TaxID=58133 RepID=UPI000698286A|nr:hypothetical protein [Nitrosospira sp. NpAV]